MSEYTPEQRVRILELARELVGHKAVVDAADNAFMRLTEDADSLEEVCWSTWPAGIDDWEPGDEDKQQRMDEHGTAVAGAILLALRDHLSGVIDTYWTASHQDTS